MTQTSDTTDQTTIVVGASRGLGRGIASAFAEAGSPVSAVARNAAPLAVLARDAGAKATQRFIAAYARDEAQRAGLDITFTAVLPRITPLTDLGRPAVRAYAARSGQSEEQYVAQFGAPLTPQIAGASVAKLAWADPSTVAPAYLLTAAGLEKLA